MEIVYDLKMIISNGRISDDTVFDNRLLVTWINKQRALWLYNEYNKGREVMNNEVQALKEVEFAVIDGNISNSIMTNCKLLQSIQTIPRTMAIQIRDMITAVRPLQVTSQRFNYVSREEAVYSGNGKFNRDMLFIFKHGDRLYIKYGDKNERTQIPKVLRVEGVFENPLEVDIFNGTIDNIWDGVDEYPISARFIEYLKGEILKSNVTSLLTYPEDRSNNDNYDDKMLTTNEQGKK